MTINEYATLWLVLFGLSVVAGYLTGMIASWWNGD